SVSGRTVPSRCTCSSILGYGTAIDRNLVAVELGSTAVQDVLLVLHVLAAAVWVGGTTALVFVGVPGAARLEGAGRSPATREFGRRWRPIGYGALLVLGVTGVPLAADDWDSGSTFRWILLAKVASAIALAALAALHDFVLGPRLSRELREGQGPRSRP